MTSTADLPTFELEDAALEEAGPNTEIAGVDEVGVGPLAGPVAAGAVILPRNGSWLGELRDSKAIKRADVRERLAKTIKERAVSWGIGWVHPNIIDDLGIFAARGRAMMLAFHQCQMKYDGNARLIAIVDGYTMKKFRDVLGGEDSVFYDKGDSKSLSVAAASIIAKVARDEHMTLQARRYPGYGFEQHKGYPTPKHKKMLKAKGPSPIHRMSFGPVKSARIDD